jgi:flagellar assembly protein FliH
MSSSKVFKKIGTFIPEKIIPTKKELPEWKSVTIPAGKKNERFVSGIDKIDYPESVYKTDFSSPEANPKAGDDPGSSIPENNLPTSPLEPSDLERLREEAYNQGLRDGMKMAEEDFGSSTKALVMACEQVNSLRETVLNNSMDEMENLVLAIAEKIIRHSVTEQNRTIVDTVAEAIRQAVKSDELVIHVNPADFAVIKAKSKEFIDAISGLENVVVQADPAIEQGGCSIDSSTSTVDATIAGQLRMIEEKIKGKT